MIFDPGMRDADRALIAIAIAASTTSGRCGNPGTNASRAIGSAA